MGDVRGPVATPTASPLPLLVASGAAYVVPANSQQAVPLDIVVDGELTIDGELVFL